MVNLVETMLRSQQATANPQGGITTKDLLNMQLQKAQLTQQQKQQQRLQDLVGKASQGDQSALQRLLAVDPERAQKVSDFQTQRQQMVSEQGARLASEVLRAPEGMRQEVYKQNLLKARELGLDVDGMPEQYSEQVEFGLQNMIAQARDVEDVTGPIQGTAEFEQLQRQRAEEERAQQAFPLQQRLRETQAEQAGAEAQLATAETSQYRQPVTPAQSAVDKAFAKDYVSFVRGGAADAAKNISQIKEVANLMESGSNLTGAVIGSLPDTVLKFVNPESIDARELVEEVVQRNLREVLGAQFTEKEGERLIKRAYNPQLSEEKNAQRLKRLSGAMESAYQAKLSAARYFEENGTLTGWEGEIPTIGMIESMAFDGSTEDSAQGGKEGSETFRSLREKYGLE